MDRNITKSIKLSLFFFWLLFLSGRVGLFLHEFAGHALLCKLMGGRFAGFSLFVFGGGRVQCDQAPAAAHQAAFSVLAFDLSGIAVELAVGVLLAMVLIYSKARRPFRLLLASTSSVLIVHALFYLTISAYYGSGDGHHLFAILKGFYRPLFISLTFGLAVASAFLVACAFAPTAKSWVAGDSPKRSKLTILVCAFCAAMLHGALTVGEQIVSHDNAYKEIKRPESVKLKQKKISEFVAGYTQEHGKVPDLALLSNVKDELEQKYWQFPIEFPLGIAIALAFVSGFLFSKPRDNENTYPVRWRHVVFLGGFSIVVAIVILIMNRI